MVGNVNPVSRVCIACNARWKSKAKYYWWPIRLRWVRGRWGYERWFQTHGIEITTDDWGNVRYSRTLHLGRLKVCFGPKVYQPRDREMRCPFCYVSWFDGNRVVA